MVRLKARYILFDIIYPKTSESQENYSKKTSLLQLHSTTSQQAANLRSLAELIRKNVQHLFGDNGLGVSGLSVIIKYFSAKTSTGIIRCSRDFFKYVCAALTIITNLNGKSCIFRIIRISGTIKKCEKAAIDRNRTLMKSLHVDDFQDDEIGNIVDDDDEFDD